MKKTYLEDEKLIDWFDRLVCGVIFEHGSQREVTGQWIYGDLVYKSYYDTADLNTPECYILYNSKDIWEVRLDNVVGRFQMYQLVTTDHITRADFLKYAKKVVRDAKRSNKGKIQ